LLKAVKNEARQKSKAKLKVAWLWTKQQAARSLSAEFSRKLSLNALERCDLNGLSIGVKATIAGIGVASSTITPSTKGFVPDQLQVVEPAHEIAGSREEVFSTQLASLNVSALGLGGEQKLRT
jgi:hypothetical protein